MKQVETNVQSCKAQDSPTHYTMHWSEKYDHHCENCDKMYNNSKILKTHRNCMGQELFQGNEETLQKGKL